MLRRRPGSGFFASMHRRELAVVYWLWPQIDDRERAGKALGYARRGGVMAAILILVPVFFPDGFDQEEGWGLAIDYAALLDVFLLVQVALYVYIYVEGYKRWEAIAIALVLFVFAAIALPMLEDDQSWFAIMLGLYVARCFAIGLKSRRLLDRFGDADTDDWEAGAGDGDTGAGDGAEPRR